MTHSINRVVLGTIAAIAVVAAAGVYAAHDQNTNAQPPPFMGRGGGPGGRMGPGGLMGLMPRLGRELNLTDSQRDQIQAIAATHRDEWKALADRMRAAHEGLGNAVTGDTIDETLIRAKSAEVAAVEADMAVARAHAFAEVSQVLTADQKAKLKELRTQMRDRIPKRGAPQP